MSPLMSVHNEEAWCRGPNSQNEHISAPVSVSAFARNHNLISDSFSVNHTLNHQIL